MNFYNYGNYGLIIAGFFLLFSGLFVSLFCTACGIFNKPRNASNLIMIAIAMGYLFFARLGWNIISSYWPIIINR